MTTRLMLMFIHENLGFKINHISIAQRFCNLSDNRRTILLKKQIAGYAYF